MTLQNNSALFTLTKEDAMKHLVFVSLPEQGQHTGELLDLGAALRPFFSAPEDLMFLRAVRADSFRAVTTVLTGISSTAAISPDQLSLSSACTEPNSSNFEILWSDATKSPRNLVIVLTSPEYAHGFFGWCVSKIHCRNDPHLPRPISPKRLLVFRSEDERFSFIEKQAQ